MNQQDPFGEKRLCLKANLHMHTTGSDGKFTAQEITDLYANHDYDVLAFTDHRVAAQLDDVNPRDMVFIPGMEIHPAGPRNIMLHFVALDLPSDFVNPDGLSWRQCLDAVQAVGGKAILAHPHWCGLNTAEIHELLETGSFLGMEVYNTSTRYIGKQFNMCLWDNVLDLGIKIPAVAVDDTHNPQDLFYGWTMICARERTRSSVMEALSEGHFYSSMGPVFHKIEFKERCLSVECSPVEELIFVMNKSAGCCGHICDIDACVRDGKYIPGVQKTVTSFSAEIPDGVKYVRCQIKDGAGKYAWTNPFYL